MGEMVQFQRPDGNTARGYLAEPASDARGNVVVIHEWWGLRDEMKRVCDRIASEGYRALAPDLYAGTIARDEGEAGAMMQALDWGGAIADIRGALAHVKDKGGRAAVLGFCMGGALSIAAGVSAPETDAVICFYGIPDEKAFDPATIRKPFIGHFANSDNWITPKRVNHLEERLRAGGGRFVIHRYDAHHAFMNEARPEVHDPEAAERAWERTRAFLEQTICEERGS